MDQISMFTVPMTLDEDEVETICNVLQFCINDLWAQWNRLPPPLSEQSKEYVERCRKLRDKLRNIQLDAVKNRGTGTRGGGTGRM